MNSFRVFLMALDFLAFGVVIKSFDIIATLREGSSLITERIKLKLKFLSFYEKLF